MGFVCWVVAMMFGLLSGALELPVWVVLGVLGMLGVFVVVPRLLDESVGADDEEGGGFGR